MEASAYAALGDAAQLERGVDLTLFEREQAAGRQPVYWVMPVIRERQLGKLSAKARKALHAKAFIWYEKQIEAAEEPDYELLQEAVYHGLFCDQVRSACRYAIDLGDYLNNLLLYGDKVMLQQAVADRITDSVVAEAKKEKDENVSTLLNNLGFTYHDLGDAKKAISYYEQALAIFKSIYGDDHPSTQIVFENMNYLINEIKKGE